MTHILKKIYFKRTTSYTHVVGQNFRSGLNLVYSSYSYDYCCMFSFNNFLLFAFFSYFNYLGFRLSAVYNSLIINSTCSIIKTILGQYLNTTMSHCVWGYMPKDTCITRSLTVSSCNLTYRDTRYIGPSCLSLKNMLFVVIGNNSLLLLDYFSNQLPI